MPLYLRILLAFLTLLTLEMSNFAFADNFRIGVRAHNGINEAVEKWGPTIEYLNKELPQHHFELHPVVSLSAINNEAAAGVFDFIITNPSSYVEMEVKYGASRLLTLLNKRNQRSYDRFGSVIFALKSNPNIRGPQDFADKRLIAVSERAFGGWQVAKKELIDRGFVPEDTFSKILFADGLQKNVVQAIIDGKADIGIVRTDMLERLTAEGMVRFEDFRIMLPKTTPGFEFAHSTRLYPEWSFAKLPQMPLDVAKEVTIKLLQIKQNNIAAVKGKYTGWSVPKDYAPVHDLLKTLKAEPYSNFGEITFSQALRAYWIPVILVSLALFTMILISLHMIRTNRELYSAKEQLSRTHEILEEKVSERTRELEEEITRRSTIENELIASRDIAERANQAKSDFLSSMSHELRTPLNAILGFSELLRTADADEALTITQAESVHEIYKAGDHLLHLINEILDIETIESGKLEINNKHIQVSPLIESCISMTSDLAARRGIHFSGNYKEQTECVINADPMRTKQVILNLISNAIKYNRDNGAVQIDIHCNANQSRIEIRDTGIGIAKEHMPSLFQPFYRINAKNSGIDGTGIGLALCLKLMKLMNGLIEVSSTSGEGSCFSIIFNHDVIEKAS